MDVKQQFELRKQLNNDGAVFCYNGYLTEDLLTSIGAVLKSKLQADNVDKRQIRSVFHFFVEQVQNIIRYSKEFEESIEVPSEFRYGLVIVGSRDGTHYVTCANLVDKSNVEQLKTTLDDIHAMSDDELKKLYKKLLRSETPENSKGAGVGFIDIARKASKFEYEFFPVDANSSYFSLTSYL